MELRACKKCQLVSEEVGLYHHELDWQGPSEYLCVECQKKAFHFHVKMLIIGALGDRIEDSDEKRKEDATKLLTRILAFAKKNGITADYVVKLLARETATLKTLHETGSHSPDA